MKLIYTIFLLCCIGILSAAAQTEGGKLLIGGKSSFSFSSMDRKIKINGEEEDYGSVKQIDFSPQIGIFLFDNFALGAEVSFQTEKFKDEDGDETKEKATVYMPFAKMYFGHTSTKPYVNLGVGFGKSKFEDYDSDETKFNLGTYEFGGGVAIHLNKSVMLDMGVVYSSLTKKTDDSSEAKLIVDALSVNFGFTISL